MARHAIFVSYRRDDTADAAGRIYDHLVAAFGSEAVFKDVDSLPVGKDFGKYIEDTLADCRVLLALIGPGWLEPTADGSRRIDQPADWVRIEIEKALSMPGVQVIPVLVNLAPMPWKHQLPSSIEALNDLNAAQVRRDPDFSQDMRRLIKALQDGALTGLVKIDEPPAVTRIWSELQSSEDPDDLVRFAESFPNHQEAFEARRRADRIYAAYKRLDTRLEGSILAFLEQFPRHPEAARLKGLIPGIHRQAREKEAAFQLELREREDKTSKDIREAELVARWLFPLVVALTLLFIPFIPFSKEIREKWKPMMFTFKACVLAVLASLFFPVLAIVTLSLIEGLFDGLPDDAREVLKFVNSLFWFGAPVGYFWGREIAARGVREVKRRWPDYK